jgi:hypothetical protein
MFPSAFSAAFRAFVPSRKEGGVGPNPSGRPVEEIHTVSQIRFLGNGADDGCGGAPV